jgi:phage terminase large subunit-like protein
MTTSLPEELLGRLVPAFEAAREPERAVPAAA